MLPRCCVRVRPVRGRAVRRQERRGGADPLLPTPLKIECTGASRFYQQPQAHVQATGLWGALSLAQSGQESLSLLISGRTIGLSPAFFPVYNGAIADPHCRSVRRAWQPVPQQGAHGGHVLRDRTWAKSVGPANNRSRLPLSLTSTRLPAEPPAKSLFQRKSRRNRALSAIHRTGSQVVLCHPRRGN